MKQKTPLFRGSAVALVTPFDDVHLRRCCRLLVLGERRKCVARLV